MPAASAGPIPWWKEPTGNPSHTSTAVPAATAWWRPMGSKARGSKAEGSKAGAATRAAIPALPLMPDQPA